MTLSESEIKDKLKTLIKLAEYVSITNMSEFLSSITSRLTQFTKPTLQIIFGFLYNYVDDTEENYNLWYTNLQINPINMEFMQTLSPIMDWINSC